MRFGLVVGRYGAEIIGGTEHWLRLLCEHLAVVPGWDVHVFTTGAVSAVTWADERPPGTTVETGVTVHRHRSVSGRSTAYASLDGLVRRVPALLPDAVSRRFVDAVGPVCPDVIDDAASAGCDLMAVTPYLFWPAIEAVHRLGRRVIFHAAAHDEAELRFPLMRPVFEGVGGFSFNSFAERALVERHFRIAHLPAAVVGNAVVEVAGRPERARAELGLGADEPFVLCLGRVERVKGSHELAEMWGLYRRRRPGAPRLVLLGVVNEPLAGDSDVIVAGPCSEAVKWGALRSCRALVSPSAWESFSLVVVEAWLAGVPVVVNGRCPATVEHCRRGQGGLWFDGYAEFEVIMDRLLGDEALRAELAASGERYARAAFAWGPIVERYRALAERVVDRVG